MIREIQIRAALNGFVVNVGCQTLVFTSKSDLLSQLTEYLNNPKDTEKNFVATACNREHTMSEPNNMCGQEAYPCPPSSFR